MKKILSIVLSVIMIVCFTSCKGQKIELTKEYETLDKSYTAKVSFEYGEGTTADNIEANSAEFVNKDTDFKLNCSLLLDEYYEEVEEIAQEQIDSYKVNFGDYDGVVYYPDDSSCQILIELEDYDGFDAYITASVTAYRFGGEIDMPAVFNSDAMQQILNSVKFKISEKEKKD